MISFIRFLLMSAPLIACLSLFFITENKFSPSYDTAKKNSPLEYLLSTPLFSRSNPVIISSEITAYCTGSCCNSGSVIENGETVQKDWSNMIAAGSASMNSLHSAGIEIAAVDTDVIPFGSIIKYKGIYYAALDRGYLIRGTDIDLAMSYHKDAEKFGRRAHQTVEVYLPSKQKEALAVIFSIAGHLAFRNHP